jgi:hypothetical protein
MVCELANTRAPWGRAHYRARALAWPSPALGAALRAARSSLGPQGRGAGQRLEPRIAPPRQKGCRGACAAGQLSVASGVKRWPRARGGPWIVTNRCCKPTGPNGARSLWPRTPCRRLQVGQSRPSGRARCSRAGAVWHLGARDAALRNAVQAAPGCGRRGATRPQAGKFRAAPTQAHRRRACPHAAAACSITLCV